MASRHNGKQNVTISLSRQVLKKAKIVAARRETSISGLLAQQIEFMVGDEEAYEQAEREARALLDKGFHMGVYFEPAETNCMSDRTFVDTNVLIYTHDVDAESKHQVANTVLGELWEQRRGVAQRSSSCAKPSAFSPSVD